MRKLPFKLQLRFQLRDDRCLWWGGALGTKGVVWGLQLKACFSSSRYQWGSQWGSRCWCFLSLWPSPCAASLLTAPARPCAVGSLLTRFSLSVRTAASTSVSNSREMGRGERDGGGGDRPSPGGVTVKIHWPGLGLKLPLPLSQGCGLTLRSLMALKVIQSKAKCGCQASARLRVYTGVHGGGREVESWTLAIQIQGFPALQHGVLTCFQC